MFLFLMLFFGKHEINILSVKGQINTELPGRILGVPSQVATDEKGIYLIDSKTLSIWVCRFGERQPRVFSARGDAMGLLRDRVIGMYMGKDDDFQIIHGNGVRQDRFSKEGELLSSEPLTAITIYSRENMNIVSSKALFRVSRIGKEVRKHKGFEDVTCRSSLATAMLGNHLIVVNQASSDNTIRYFTFNTVDGYLKYLGVIPKIRKTVYSSLPLKMRQRFDGYEMRSLTFPNFQCVVGCAGMGFIITEYTDSVESGTLGVFHVVNPEVKEPQTYRVLGGKRYAFFIPKLPFWIGFNLSNNHLEWLEVEEVN